MADLKISELTAKTTLSNDDLFVIANSEVANTNNKVKLSSILSKVTATEPLVNTNGTLSITKATSSTNGYLDKDDFSTFSNKETVQTVDNAPTSPLTIAANTVYKFGSAITELTISNRVDSTEEIEIQFTTGGTFSFTATAWANYWVNGAPSFSANKSYVIAFKNGYGAWGEVA